LDYLRLLWYSDQLARGFRALLTPIAGERTSALIDAYHGFERRLEAERPRRLYRDVLTTGLIRGAQQIDLPFPPEQADVLARQWGELPLYDDAPDALSALRASGFRLAF
jgi:hypothetical protein